MKPMSVDEAAMQLSALKQDFMVFANSRRTKSTSSTGGTTEHRPDRAGHPLKGAGPRSGAFGAGSGRAALRFTRAAAHPDPTRARPTGVLAHAAWRAGFGRRRAWK